MLQKAPITLAGIDPYNGFHLYNSVLQRTRAFNTVERVPLSVELEVI